MKIKFKLTAIMMLLTALTFTTCEDEGGNKGTIPTAPSAPGAAIITVIDSQLSISWIAVDKATAYEVWYHTENNSLTATQSSGYITGTKHAITGLIKGFTYYVWLKAKNSIGASDFGTVAIATINYYIVTYDSGTGNTEGSVPVDSNEYDYNDTVTVLDNSGYLIGPEIQDNIRQKFAEWNTLADGNGTTYVPGTSFPITENTTLYAIYTTDLSVLGKIGLAYGWVFYNAGSIQSWGQYLEAAPASTEWTEKQWGASETDINGDNDSEATKAIPLAEAKPGDIVTFRRKEREMGATGHIATITKIHSFFGKTIGVTVLEGHTDGPNDNLNERFIPSIVLKKGGAFGWGHGITNTIRESTLEFDSIRRWTGTPSKK